MHTIKGRRYLTQIRPVLANFVRDRLHYLDFDEACRFYRSIQVHLTPVEQAFLACNDRFYLLVGLLNNKYALHPWIYDRCREVEADPDGYLDLWARFHLKSTIVTFAGCIQEMLIDPEITIAIFSFNKKVAAKFLSQIKQELERNERLKGLFPDILWKDPKKQASRWALDKGLVVQRQANPKEATIEAHGLIDGMPTGGHWRLLVYDDLITEKYAKSPDMIAKAVEQWELSDNLGVGETTRKQMVGTRYSFGDPYTTVLARGVKARLYPATDDGTLTGNPVYLTPEYWEKLKETQRGVVAAQHLQNPLAGKENTFMVEWLRGWEVRPSIMNVYIMVDPNKGQSRRSDRTGIAVVGVDGAGNKYLLDGYRHRMSLEDRWVAVRDLYRKWTRQPGIGMVDVGYERYGVRDDENYFREAMAREGLGFSLRVLNWVGTGDQSKKGRVERLEPDFRHGRFLLPAVTWDERYGGPCLWRYDREKNQIVERPMGRENPGFNPDAPMSPQNRQYLVGMTKAMAEAQRRGASHLVAKPIKRTDEDGNLYDVTLALIQEMLLFPFAPKDDLVDAVSRIYDMEIVSPSIREDREVERLSRALEEV